MKLTETESIIVRGQMEQRAQRIVLRRNKELGECTADRHAAGVLEIGEQRARWMRGIDLIGVLAGQIAQAGRNNADFGVTYALKKGSSAGVLKNSDTSAGAGAIEQVISDFSSTIPAFSIIAPILCSWDRSFEMRRGRSSR